METTRATALEGKAYNLEKLELFVFLIVLPIVKYNLLCLWTRLVKLLCKQKYKFNYEYKKLIFFFLSFFNKLKV